MSLWSRLLGRIRAEGQQQAVELSQMSPSERAFAEQAPLEHALDGEIQGRLGGSYDPESSDDPDDLLSGPSS
jgi:hypothetical protein